MVNVIDILFVLFVVAIIIAGVALVDPFTASDGATRYATVDLGDQPDYLVESVTAGDVMELENSPNNLTITDVYRGPAENGTLLVVRVRVNGERIEDTEGPTQFLFGEEPFLVGQELTIKTVDYSVDGQISRVDAAGDSLSTAVTPVVLQTSVPANIVDDIQPGDTFDVNGDTIATLETVTVYPTADPMTKRVLLGVELLTRVDGDRRLFADREVWVGTTVPFRTAAHEVSGEVVRRDSVDPPGEPSTTTVTLRLENVPPERAANIQVGQTETVRDKTLARVLERNATPAVVILESEDGDIFEREHPRNLDITLTVELRTRETKSNLWFHGDTVQIGDTVAIDLGDITIRGTVTGIDRG